jgi:hypothetical protein
LRADPITRGRRFVCGAHLRERTEDEWQRRHAQQQGAEQEQEQEGEQAQEQDEKTASRGKTHGLADACGKRGEILQTNGVARLSPPRTATVRNTINSTQNGADNSGGFGKMRGIAMLREDRENLHRTARQRPKSPPAEIFLRPASARRRTRRRRRHQ